MACVGIIANPASGKDIRRLVAHGSVFSNTEKVNIVRRALLGLDAVGVNTIITMPDTFDICRKAQEQLALRATVKELDMPVFSTQADTTRAGAAMRAQGVNSLISLGGDGTNRALAKTCGDIPLLPLSTGTNNVFPFMFEGTLAGLAAGLVARGVAITPESVEQRPRLDILIQDEIVDLALVDAVICTETAVGARAIWDIHTIQCVVVAQRLPAQIGFVALAGNLPLSESHAQGGMIIETHPEGAPVLTPIAPGLIIPMGVKRYTALASGMQQEIAHGPCLIALDGEREITVRPGQRVAVRLNAAGPRVINPQQVLALAAQRGVFLQTQAWL